MVQCAAGRAAATCAAHTVELAELLVHPRLLEVAKAALDSHIRVLRAPPPVPPTMTPPGPSAGCRRAWRSDPPHDLLDAEASGAVRWPFPAIAAALTVVVLLESSDGLAYVVPGSHRESARHPCAPGSTLNQHAPIRGEVLLAGRAGTVFLFDSRLWRSDQVDPVTATASLAPWWLSCEFGRLARQPVPAAAYNRMTAAAQLLFRHRAEGVGDLIQQPRPMDGWRQDREAPRMDNGWVAVAGVEPTFVGDYYVRTGARRVHKL